VTLLAALAGVLLAGLAALALLRPVLRRMAARNALRRKGEALLVVLGCMVGTAIITGSLLVGDTLDRSLRDRALDRLGPIDVVVSTYAAPIADSAAEILTLEPLRNADGVLPATTLGVTLATPQGPSDGREVLPDARLVELDFREAARFGGDASATGISGPAPGPDEVVLAEDAARELGVGAGDSVEAYAYGQFRLLRVARVLPAEGVAGYAGPFDAGAMNAFVAPGTVALLASSAGISSEAVPAQRLIFVSATGDELAGAVGTEPLLRELRGRLGTLVGHEIDPVKRDLLDQAAEEGDSFSELFVSLGAFAVLAGVALLVNMLIMLAEERRYELGVARSLGMRRSGVFGAFVLEGAAYALVASLLGAAAGVGVAALIVALASNVFSAEWPGGLELRFGAEPGTLLLGFLSGLTVTLAVVAAASAWNARLTVSEAIGGPDRRGGPRRRTVTLAALAVGALASAAASAVSVARSDDLGSLAFPSLAVTCSCALAVLILRRSPGVRLGARRWLGTAVVVGGCLAVMLWSVLAFPLLGLDVDDVTLFVVQGLALTLASVVLLGGQGGRLEGTVRGFGGRAGLALRVALAYPSTRRFRTGATILAYALIVFTLVFSSVLVNLFSGQRDELARDEGGGYDLLVTTGEASPVPREDLAAVEGVGESIATLDWTVADFRVLKPEGASGDWAISGFDEELVAGGPPALEGFDRGRFPDETAVWRAVLEDPSLAIADVAFLETGGGPPEDNVVVGDRVRVQAPQSDEVVEREVVAVSSAGAAFSGVMVSKGSLSELIGDPVGNRHYVSVAEGADPVAVAARLEEQFLPNGLQARPFGEVVGEALADQERFFGLINGYLALGLFVGVAGLGVVMARAVGERRRQIGVLLSLGFPASAVRWAFLLEAVVISLAGTLVGAALALLTTYQLAVLSDAFGSTGVAFAVPWGQLSLLLAGVLLASLAATYLSASRAASLAPADALRAPDQSAA